MLIYVSINLVPSPVQPLPPPHWFYILSLIEGCTLRKSIVNISLLFITLILNFLHPLLSLFFSWGLHLCCPQSSHLHTKQWKKFPYLLLSWPAKILFRWSHKAGWQWYNNNVLRCMRWFFCQNFKKSNFVHWNVELCFSPKASFVCLTRRCKLTSKISPQVAMTVYAEI